MVQTRLVAADAGVDVFWTMEPGLLDEMGVCQKRTGHADHVRTTFCKRLFARGRIVEAVGGDEGHTHLPHQLLGDKPEPPTGNHGGDGWNACFMPADARVDQIYACTFGDLGQPFHFLPAGPSCHQIEHAQPVHDEKVVPDGFSNARENLFRETAATLKVSAPPVGAVIGFRDKKLVDEVPFGPHDFNPVVPGLAGKHG